MYFRKIRTNTTVLPTLIRQKALEDDWGEILSKADNVNELHSIFEDMFIEEIKMEAIELFHSKYIRLSQEQKRVYLKELLDKYKEFGEYGFNTIALQTLLKISRKSIDKT